ncbi:hypothetical protein KJ975_08520 [Myxococcota bacterium]|nr:hypothetical protein [Myxococcota bacterium]
MNTHFLPCALFLLVVGSAGCRKSADAGPVEWPGTVTPCAQDDECAKVVAFYSGCGNSAGYLEAIHRTEIELYKRMYWEYQEQRKPTMQNQLQSSDKTCGLMVMARCRDRRCTLIDEKVEIPEEELKKPHQEKTTPPEYRKTAKERRACVRDGDCAKVRADRCWDRYEAVNRKFEKIFRDVRYRDVLPIDCPRIAPDPTSAPEVIPVCHQGQCQLTGGDYSIL